MFRTDSTDNGAERQRKFFESINFIRRSSDHKICNVTVLFVIFFDFNRKSK